jgi:phytoene dehydrogenase-like protein
MQTSCPTSPRRACVIGSGPNGLAAAITLAQAGLQVDVFEAQAQPGGAVRTMELTLPGYYHDFGSAVYPFAAGSPFFSSLPLAHHGLEWIHSAAPLVHPLDDGTAVVIERDLNQIGLSLGAEDAKAWRDLMHPLAENWSDLAHDTLRPQPSIPRRPFLLARFGMRGLLPARGVANSVFRGERAKAAFAGLAAHSILSLEEPLSASFALMLGAALHSVGWPIPRGGAQSLTNALCSHLAGFGAEIKTAIPINDLAALEGYNAILCDIGPHQLARISGNRLSPAYRRKLQNFQYGPGVFKVDYALAQPIPWKAQDCLRAATIHVGGSFAEIVLSEKSMRAGGHAEKPFVLLVQPSLFDPSRAPAGKHTAWAYCHVPNGSTYDMLPRIEAQIERFAPGFCECILARRVFAPAALEAMDANLVGGDVAGGVLDWRHLLFRPTWRHYATSSPQIYLCSGSTPPGGGVHGMCGYHASQLALSRVRLS